MKTAAVADARADPGPDQVETLPEGWFACTMGDVARVVGGGTPSTSESANFSSDGVAWVTPADLGSNEDVCIFGGRRYLSEKGLKSSSAVLVPPGTVLFSSRAPIGHVAIAGQELATNQGCRNFVCYDGVLPEFIYYYMKFAKPLAEGLASGTTFLEISGSNAARIPINIPPTREQRRIAAILRETGAVISRVRERLANVRSLVKRFRQSVLAAACSGRLTADWREQQMGFESPQQLLERIAYRRLKSCDSARMERSRSKRQTLPPPIVNVADESAQDSRPEIPVEWGWYRCEQLCVPERSLTYGVIKLGPTVPSGIPTLRSSDVR